MLFESPYVVFVRVAEIAKKKALTVKANGSNAG